MQSVASGSGIPSIGMTMYHGLHLSTCTNEPFGEDLCARCEAVIKKGNQICVLSGMTVFCEWRATLVCGSVRLLLVTRHSVTHLSGRLPTALVLSVSECSVASV